MCGRGRQRCSDWYANTLHGRARLHLDWDERRPRWQMEIAARGRVPAGRADGEWVTGDGWRACPGVWSKNQLTRKKHFVRPWDVGVVHGFVQKRWDPDRL